MDRVLECHRLASEIEWIHARDLSRRDGPRRRKWEEFYDPHAATELGDLIYNRLFRGDHA